VSAADPSGPSVLGGADLADLALAALARPHHGGSQAFSSDLSVDEAILLSETGYEPRRLVVGSSIFHVGLVGAGGGLGASGAFGSPSNSYGGEITGLSHAMNTARVQAMHRLVNDARGAGGEGVIGVRLEVSMHRTGKGVAEFTAIGTAIAHSGKRGGRPAGAPNYCFTSDLSGQDFYLLHRAGYQPVGMVFGNCVYQAPRSLSQRTSTANVELTGFTEALSTARELAMGRLQREAEQLNATGIVGVTVSEQSHAWWRRAIEFLAYGTAVRLTGTTPGRHDAPPPASGGDLHRHLGVRAVVQLDDPDPVADPAAITGRRPAGAGGPEGAPGES
jgi:uncharacterized protein YbjQ (UPF0145 family)